MSLKWDLVDNIESSSHNDNSDWGLTKELLDIRYISSNVEVSTEDKTWKRSSELTLSVTVKL